jgi:hypothetical protein
MKKIAIALIFMLAILGLVSGCADSPTLKRSNAPSDVLKRPSIEKRAKKKTSRTLSKVPSDVRDELSSELKASPTTPKAPSVISPPSGFYSLDTLIDFDTLDEVTYNSVKGTLSLSGHRIRTDRKADVHYLNLLADALDSDKPVFSLEWTPSSQREVDRAFAYFSDDRNNEEITTKLSKIFDANGRLNRKGALFFKALGVDVREGMNRYEFNSGLLTASGHENAGTVLRAFGSWMEAAKRDDTAGVKSGLEDLINALGLYDFTAENAARFRNGQITQVQLMDLVMPRILSGLANAFGWDDSPYVDKYWRLRRSGSSFEDAGSSLAFDRCSRDFPTNRSLPGWPLKRTYSASHSSICLISRRKSQSTELISSGGGRSADNLCPRKVICGPAPEISSSSKLPMVEHCVSAGRP